MNEQEAIKIITDLLTKSGRSEITVQQLHHNDGRIISATVSYVWYLNGHKKNVPKNSATAYKDENNNWQLLGF